jgi:hypothetical protein
MQNLTDQAEPEAPIPTETVSNGPNWERTVAVRRKAAMRTLPFGLAAEELHLVPSSSLSSPRAEDIPAARKKPRLEESLPTETDEAARKTASPDVSVGLSPPVADNHDEYAEPVKDTQPNARAAWATGSWTLQEDAKLTSAVANTSKKWWGKEYKTDWVVVAALFPSRTNRQCWNRWKDVLDPNIDRTSGRKGNWTADEDIKLKDAVQAHGGKNWGAIAALVPDRTKKQSMIRWHSHLDPSINSTTAQSGKWTSVEDIKLKDAVQVHGGENWCAISALVPGRSKAQCSGRWRTILDTNIDPTTARAGSWTADEDKKLKDAVLTHGGKDWAVIVALVPGRTRKQCSNRWHSVLDTSIDQATARAGRWTADEDKKLKDAVQTHGGKDWAAVAELISGRTKSQCWSRWKQATRHMDTVHGLMDTDTSS